jgi:hypothetical protein
MPHCSATRVLLMALLLIGVVSPIHAQSAAAAAAVDQKGEENKFLDYTQRYSPGMKEPVIPFRPKPAPLSARPVAEEHSRMIFNIGGRRYAFEFQTIVIEVHPVDAQVISIRQSSR